MAKFNYEKTEKKIRDTLAKVGITNVEFNDSDAYDNGEGLTHQWFVYNSNVAFKQIEDLEEKLDNLFTKKGFDLCKYDEDEDKPFYTIELEADYSEEYTYYDD